MTTKEITIDTKEMLSKNRPNNSLEQNGNFLIPIDLSK